MIRLRRGQRENLPTLTGGEPGICLDTGEFFIGCNRGNVKINGPWVMPEAYGAKGDGTTDDTVAIQAAADAALASGDWLQFGPKTYKITDTLTIKCNVAPNAGELYVYSRPSPAVAIGTSTAGASIQDKQIWLPTITSKTYAGVGDWSAENDGVVVYGLYQCEVHTQTIWGFDNALHLYADGVGISYNNFYVGVLRGSHIALYLERVNSGWVNENNFYGGRYRIDGAEGNVETVDQIALDRAPAATNTTTVIISTTDLIGGTQTGANDAYNGWYLYNETRGAGSIISDTTYDAGNAELTFTLADAITGQVAGDAIEIMSSAQLYDAHYIKMGKSTLNTGNNNVFYKPCLEGGGPRYQIEVYGNYNLFISPRTEVPDAHFRVHYGTTTGSSYSQGNILLYPFGGETLDIDEDTTPVSSWNNHVIGSSGTYLASNQGDGVAALTLQNSGNAYPNIHIIKATASLHGSHTTDWVGQWTAATLQLKDDTDAYGAVKITGADGSVYVGNGTATPTAGLYSTGAATCGMTAATAIDTTTITMKAGANREINHGDDDNYILVCGGPSYTTGSSIQVSGADAGANVFNVSGVAASDKVCYWEYGHRSTAGYVPKARLTYKGNMDLGGTTSWGTSTTNTKAQYSGTAPSSSITDGYLEYSADIVAGNAAPHFRTEAGNIVKLYKQVLAADLEEAYETPELDTEAEVIAALNATNAKINDLIAALQNTGLLASS